MVKKAALSGKIVGEEPASAHNSEGVPGYESRHRQVAQPKRQPADQQQKHAEVEDARNPKRADAAIARNGVQAGL